ncbi:hypothetical protein JR316_0010902 [Psilocybe cubensis]|uniref:Uncharacterized protein n=2 Tax=Psilocybe cubensis TaxID=181762 RepID=A0A8H7XMR9_PSICU|nr:hypothetical protein JR316_0010902 [Psilocybe cubensis]KAH9476986.1 hypothetical protein JR316_0010902 [Psilocybe cubensis]
MADLVQTQSISPIIPVTDERIECLPTAPKDYRLKVQQYNDLLEDIFQRELELSNIKSTLIDMREMLAQEARILDGTTPLDAATKSDASDSDEILSDSGSSSDKNGKPADPSRVKAVRKPKAKARGNRRSKVPDVQLGGEWDYNLEFSERKGRRASDASLEDVDEAMV